MCHVFPSSEQTDTRKRCFCILKLVLIMCCIKVDTNGKGNCKSLGATSDLLRYLFKFGYLPERESNSLLTQSQVADAVKNLQFFAQLNVTGELDLETSELLSKPRCGVPDVSYRNFRNKRTALDLNIRVKRYNLQGQRWARTNLTWSLKRAPSKGIIATDLVRRELHKALLIWSTHTQLQFVEVSNDATADLQVTGS